MKDLSEIEESIAAKQAELDVLQKQRTEKLCKTIVRCESHGITYAPRKTGGCGMALEVGELVYTQIEHYVGPYGCTGGDYWTWSESNAEFECPKCGGVNRLFSRPEVRKLKPYFKKIEHRKDD